MERRQDPHIRTGRRPRSGAGRGAALLFGALLAACGGSPAADGTPPPTPLQMGGAIQGVPLALTGSVSTLAGAALGAGGGPRQANFDHPVRVVADGSYA